MPTGIPKSGKRQQYRGSELDATDTGMMSIDIDIDVYRFLVARQRQGQSLNNVLRQLLGIDPPLRNDGNTRP
jgi:hypothetical protein